MLQERLCYMCGGPEGEKDKFLHKAQTKPEQYPIHKECAEYLRDLN